MTTTRLNFTASCPDCGFASRDVFLLNNHNCDVQLQGGSCEDYPACGHERGDCNGLLYGSDESIKAQVERDWATGHGMCDHADGLYECDFTDEYDGDDDEDNVVLGAMPDSLWSALVSR